MHQQRLTTRLISMWETIGGGEALPQFSHFNHQKIEDVWQNCMVLIPLPKAANQNQSTLQLQHVGQKLSTIMGSMKMGSHILSRAKSFQASKIIGKVDDVLVQQQPQPVEEAGQFVSENNKIVKYRSCLLPFGTETDGVTHVLVGLSWREF